MATKSANTKYEYNKEYFGKSLNEWAIIAHTELSKASGWAVYPLKPGSFGYDNMIVSIGHMFNNMTSKNITHLAELIHDGWAINYIYWRDNKPGKKTKTPNVYSAPSKALGDERRNMLAITKYSDIPSDEKNKDIIVAKAIVKHIFRYGI